MYSELPYSFNQTQEEFNNIIGSIGLDDIQSYAEDIALSWYIYLIAIPITFILIFLWNWMLRLFAQTLAWISIVTVGLMIVALGFGLKYYAGTNYRAEDSTYKWLTYAAYTTWGLAGVYVLVILCTYYAIKISIKVLKVSAKIVSRNLRMVIVPLIGIVVMVVWICFYAYCLLWLMSCGEMIKVDVPLVGSYYSYKWTDQEKWMMWFSLFMFFWVSAFLLAASQYVLIVGVANWYFKAERKDEFSIFQGYWWLFRYNIGSILFGSFIIAVVCMIRAIFEYIDNKMKNSNGGAAAAPARWLMNCIRCCLDCCHRFVKYINENAYC